MYRPNVFIASASESIDVVKAITAVLGANADVIPWQHSFGASSYTVGALTETVDKCDFGVFIVDPLDITISRKNEKSIARDNVIFELGMFVGRIGLERSIMVQPKGSDLSLPSDLKGITTVFREAEAPNGWRAAVTGACLEIEETIQRLGPHPQRTAKFSDLVGAYTHAESIRDVSERVQHMNDLFARVKEVFEQAPTSRPIPKAPFAFSNDPRYLVVYAAAVIEKPEAKDVHQMTSIKSAHIPRGNAQHKFVDAVERLFDLKGVTQSDRDILIKWLESFPQPEAHLPAKIGALKQRPLPQ